MNKIKKTLKKSAIFLSLFLTLLNNSLVLVWAQEVSAEVTPTPTEEIQTPTETPQTTATEEPATETPADNPTATPTVDPNEILNQISVTPTPDLILDTVANSTANSGGNEVGTTNADNVDITTGESSAETDSSNGVLSDSADTSTQNNNTASADANSGNNTINTTNDNTQVAVISTGDVKAFVNLVNLINTTLIDSDVHISIINLTPADSDVNLNELYSEVVTKDQVQSIEPSNMVVLNGSAGMVNNNVTVNANSGGNNANVTGGLVIIKTGNAKALANIINLINTKLISSNYFIAVVNISEGFNGNIILPRPENFLSSSGGNMNTDDNGVNVAQDSVLTVANSGGNSALTVGDNSINTGNAISIINNTMIINGNINGNQFNLVINNLGEWDGMVLGWENSTTAQQMMGYYTMLSNSGNVGNISDSNLLVVDYGFAWVKDNVTVNANTGTNSVTGANESIINTGDSIAMANLFNLINLNFFESNNFFGFINILGKWNGNLVFAYPDLEIGFEAKDDAHDIYRLKYKNIGYDKARDVLIEIKLPDGMRVEGKKNYVWKAGDVGMNNGGYIDVKVDRVEESEGIASLFIKKAIAATVSEEAPIKASIYSADPEISFDNNSTERWVTINRNIPEPSSNTDSNSENESLLPQTDVWAKNNVNDFVYAGDKVIFEVTFENKNDVVSDNNVLSHTIYDAEGYPVLMTKIDLGKIEANEKSVVTFEMEMLKDLFTTEGKYTSKSVINGRNMSGQEYSSSTGESNFDIKLKTQIVGRTKRSGVVKPVEAKVLGETNVLAMANSQDKNPNLWAYIVLMTASGIWIEIVSKRKNWLTTSKKTALYMVMITAWGFATITIFANHPGLRSRVEYFGGRNQTTTNLIGVNLK